MAVEDAGAVPEPRDFGGCERTRKWRRHSPTVLFDAGALSFIDAEARRLGMIRSGYLERAARDFAARN